MVHCSDKATQEDYSLTHKRSVHEGVKFSCDQCNYKAKWKSSLRKHIKSIHEGVKFPCNQCEYKATKNDTLLTHIRSVHLGVKFPLGCSLFEKNDLNLTDIKSCVLFTELGRIVV